VWVGGEGILFNLDYHTMPSLSEEFAAKNYGSANEVTLSNYINANFVRVFEKILVN